MDILFRLNGRIGRKEYWFGLAAVLLFFYIANEGLSPYLGPRLTIALLSAATVYPVVCIYKKRVHDRDEPAFPRVWIFVGLPVLCDAMLLLGFGFDEVRLNSETVLPVPNSLGWTLMFFSLIIGCWACIECGFLRGTRGENAYGPDPLVP